MPRRPPARWWTLLLALVGGLATTVAFPDWNWWGTAYLGIAALFLALRRDSAWWNALLGLVWGIAFFVPHLVWANYSLSELPWLALSVFESLYIAAFAAAWTWARRGETVWRSRGLQLVTFVVLWVATEEFRSAWPFGGFPWARLAFSQADSPVVSLAWAGGAPLVSATVVAIGVLVGQALLAARRVEVLAVGARLGTAVLLILVGLAVPLDTAAQTGKLRIGAVQGNVPTRGAEAVSQAREVLANHIDGTLTLLERVEPGELDVVLWPEDSSGIDPQVDDAAAAGVDSATRAVDAPILLGTQVFPATGGRYNTSILWDPVQGPVATYAKQRPAPFAEYVPLRDLLRPISADVDLVTVDMLAGDSVGLIPLDSARLERTVGLGTVICFEVAYDRLVRDAVRAGGEILVVQTNNASFGFSAESTQQLAMSRLRAIEHGRATVQISTVGVSAVIAPNGAVSQRTDLFTAAQLVADLPLRDSLTPADRLGSWPVRALDVVAILMILSGMAGARRIRRRDREEEVA